MCAMNLQYNYLPGDDWAAPALLRARIEPTDYFRVRSQKSFWVWSMCSIPRFHDTETLMRVLMSACIHAVEFEAAFEQR